MPKKSELEEKSGKSAGSIEEILSSLESSFEIFETSMEEKSFAAKIDRSSIHDVLSFLKDEGFDHLSDVTCVDYIDEGEFELIYHLWSHSSKLREL